jgi:hypothetical protein
MKTQLKTKSYVSYIQPDVFCSQKRKAKDKDILIYAETFFGLLKGNFLLFVLHIRRISAAKFSGYVHKPSFLYSVCVAVCRENSVTYRKFCSALLNVPSLSTL